MNIIYFKNIFLFILFFLKINVFCQEKTQIQKNKTLNKNIHTVLLHLEGDPLSYPIIKLNSLDKLQLSFDDFNDEFQEYYYSIYHCNSDWTLSDLMQSEYIDGFFENKISDYEYSFNTSISYTNYNLIFPEQILKPKLSGNYIISVFTNNNPEEVVFQKRFKILDEKISINAKVKRSTLINERLFSHEIDFNIDYGNLYIPNPYSDIKIILKQNNREDNDITNLKPLFVKQNQLIYDYEEGNTFEAGNEFRYFDTKSIRYHSEKIKEIEFDSNEINVELFTDVSKTFDEFISLGDINGNFIINKQEAWNSEIEADYVNVYFSLLENRRPANGDIYIIGRFSDWDLNDKYKLNWNEKTRKYECKILLKQGFYNYLYVLKENNNNKTNSSYIEGSHYQVNNDYYIYVYFKDIGNNYEQLIGYLKTSSNLF